MCGRRVSVESKVEVIAVTTAETANHIAGKGKSVPGPQGSRKLRFPDYIDKGTGWWQVCQPYVPVAFTPRKCYWYSFLLEAESTSGP
jgi:hypothetical protein